MSVKIIRGDARSTGLPDKSVHCIATSPPYWGLRSYLEKDDPNKALEIGAELTPDAYVESMRAVGRECYRVLRDDGVMWMNLGDTYASGGDLVGIPWRVAFALQSDGWILRSAIPWVKDNGMPESVTNRPTVAHEYVFLLAKKTGYFYDADATRVKMSSGSCGSKFTTGKTVAPHGRVGQGERMDNPGGRNIRTSDFMSSALDEYEAYLKRVRIDGGFLLSPDGGPLTFIVNPVPNSLGHFAMWPPRLVAPMILAGTSERGCCPMCGTRWRRKMDKLRLAPAAPSGNSEIARGGVGLSGRESHLGNRTRATNLGFFHSCSCAAHEPIPCTVFDPFGGSVTTAAVAEALSRNSVLCELNEAYHPLIRQRLAERLNPADWKPIPQAPAEQAGFGW